MLTTKSTIGPGQNHGGIYEHEDIDDDADDVFVGSSSLPSGYPVPPEQSFPADFECPFCFRLKRFQKPSDWVKHIHEDIQPFVCTFKDCWEPRSFKRKADWVRHENERHRQLEWWTCNLRDCSHKCFRKDNFVQHLVRGRSFRVVIPPCVFSEDYHNHDMTISRWTMRPKLVHHEIGRSSKQILS